MVATLGELIGDYDETHYSFTDVTGIDALRFLMEQHYLTQAELPEIGSQGVVSEVRTKSLNSSRETWSLAPNNACMVTNTSVYRGMRVNSVLTK